MPLEVCDLPGSTNRTRNEEALTAIQMKLQLYSIVALYPLLYYNLRDHLFRCSALKFSYTPNADTDEENK